MICKYWDLNKRQKHSNYYWWKSYRYVLLRNKLLISINKVSVVVNNSWVCRLKLCSLETLWPVGATVALPATDAKTMRGSSYNPSITQHKKYVQYPESQHNQREKCSWVQMWSSAGLWTAWTKTSCHFSNTQCFRPLWVNILMFLGKYNIHLIFQFWVSKTMSKPV